MVFVGGSPPFQKEGVAARPGQALAGKRNVKRAKNTSLYICFVETGPTYKMVRLNFLPVLCIMRLAVFLRVGWVSEHNLMLNGIPKNAPTTANQSKKQLIDGGEF